MNGALDRVPPTALGGKAQRAQRFAGVAARGLPDAYRCWISFIAEVDRDALLNGHATTGRSTTTGRSGALGRAPIHSTGCST